MLGANKTVQTFKRTIGLFTEFSSAFKTNQGYNSLSIKDFKILNFFQRKQTMLFFNIPLLYFERVNLENQNLVNEKIY